MVCFLESRCIYITLWFEVYLRIHRKTNKIKKKKITSFHFKSLEQSLEAGTTNGVNLNPNTPEHPVKQLETQRKTAITPLDMNRFQSKAFRAVISQHSGQASVSPAVGQPLQKEPSLHLDTPSKFLSKDKLFKPSFDVKVRFIENRLGNNIFIVYKVKAMNSPSSLKFVVVTFRDVGK